MYVGTMGANLEYRSHAKSSPFIGIAAFLAVVVALALMTIMQKQQQHFEPLPTGPMPAALVP